MRGGKNLLSAPLLTPGEYKMFVLLSTSVKRFGVSRLRYFNLSKLAYKAVSESVTERVLLKDKSHSTGLTISDPPIMVPNEP